MVGPVSTGPLFGASPFPAPSTGSMSVYVLQVHACVTWTRTHDITYCVLCCRVTPSRYSCLINVKLWKAIKVLQYYPWSHQKLFQMCSHAPDPPSSCAMPLVTVSTMPPESWWLWPSDCKLWVTSWQKSHSHNHCSKVKCWVALFGVLHIVHLAAVVKLQLQWLWLESLTFG